MPLVFALGNPGPRYARTRHNVGWWVADELVARWKAVPQDPTDAWRAWRAAVADRTCDLVVPLTFMNRSGEALAAWGAEHPFAVEELLVVSDDVYLPAGTLRLRAGGSSGGHRGLESIEAALGGRDYPRLRIGVGAAPGEQLRDHVLDTFEPEEETRVKEVVGTAAEAVETWLQEGLSAAMNRYNRRVTQEDSTS